MLSAQLEGSQGPIVFGAELAIGKFYIYDFKHSNSDFKGLGSGTFLSFPLENGIHFFDTENDYSPPVVVQMNFSLGYRF